MTYVEVTFGVKVFMQGGVDRDGFFLERFRTSGSSLGPFSEQERLVCDFGSGVEPTTCLLSLGVADVFHRSVAGGQSVTMERGCSNRFSARFKNVFAVQTLARKYFQLFAFVIDSAPKVALFTVDLDEDLAQVPLPLWPNLHLLGSCATDLGGEQRSKAFQPEPDLPMAYVDTALMQ